MQKYDLVRVIENTDMVKKGAVGVYIDDGYRCDDFVYVRFTNDGFHFDEVFERKELEVIATIDEMKYSFDQFKKSMLQEHGDMLTSILLSMGAGDRNLDGCTWKEMKELGRHFVFDWYYYDV